MGWRRIRRNQRGAAPGARLKGWQALKKCAPGESSPGAQIRYVDGLLVVRVHPQLPGTAAEGTGHDDAVSLGVVQVEDGRVRQVITEARPLAEPGRLVRHVEAVERAHDQGIVGAAAVGPR